MLDKIIIGHDATDRGDDALTLGRLLSASGNGELVVAHVYVSATYIAAAIYAEWREALRQGADDLLTTALGDAADVRKEVIESSSVVRGLHDLAREERAELLVVGSRHRAGVGRILLGSVAEDILHGAPCGVAIAPAGFHSAEQQIDRVGVGYDGQPESRLALVRAAELARTIGVGLSIIGLVEHVEAPVGAKGFAFAGARDLKRARFEHMRSELDRALVSVSDGLDASVKLIDGETETLADQDDVNLMVVGSRGYGPIRHVLLGSVSTHLVRDARFPVIVYPRSAAAAAEGGIAEAGASP